MRSAPAFLAQADGRDGSRLRATIPAIGYAVPPRVVENEPIAARLGVDTDWITSRTGIRRRHVADPETTVADLATRAATAALESAGVDAVAIDVLLVATSTNDRLLPNVAPLVAARLGAPQAIALDVGGACSGFLGALALAAGYVSAGSATTAVVIGADVFSRFIDHDDRATAALLGDGAGAAVIRPSDGEGDIGRVVMGSDGDDAGYIYMLREDAKLRMRGHETFKHGVNRMAESALESIAHAELGIDDIDLFVFHQANGRMLRTLRERLGLDPQKVADYIGEYGNTSAASIPIALANAARDGRLQDGDRVLLGAFGAGFVWGALVITWRGDAC